MAKYRAIVSIEFDDNDLEERAESIGVPIDRIDPMEAINGEMDNLSLGSGWLEQFFADERPMISRLSGGIAVEINPHNT